MERATVPREPRSGQANLRMFMRWFVTGAFIMGLIIGVLGTILLFRVLEALEQQPIAP